MAVNDGKWDFMEVCKNQEEVCDLITRLPLMSTIRVWDDFMVFGDVYTPGLPIVYANTEVRLTRPDLIIPVVSVLAVRPVLEGKCPKRICWYSYYYDIVLRFYL